MIKNSALGPIERMMQLFPDITANTIADIVGQLDTFVKEGVESEVQRRAPKAPMVLSHTGEAMVKEALLEAKGDPAKAHSLLEERLRHLEDNVGFESMNAFGEMRHSLAVEALKNTAPSKGETFQAFKQKAMNDISVHIPVKMNAFSGKREHLRFPKHCLS